MPYNAEEISRHLRLGEDSAWEFKRIEFNGDRPVSPRRDDLADEMGAFANAGGGVLLCGVTDSGDIPGMTRGQLDNLERLLVEISQDTIKPRLNIGVFRHEIDGKAVLLAEIPAGYAAHESPGGIWQRAGSSKRLLNTDEHLRLAQQRSQARFIWYDQQPVPDTGFASLERTLWLPLLSETGRADPEIGLTRMQLLALDSHNVVRATVAGLLICSSSPEQWLPNAYITATRYRGESRASGQTDNQDIHGPIHEQIRQALAFVRRNMQVAARKNPARENLPQYSETALFEAIVNAVVHRDYSIKGSRIRIAMFDDRIEINSPGGLPNGMTIDSMPARQSTRNETLTSIMSRIPVAGITGSGSREYIMERRGDGVSIIRRETQQLCGQFPVFDLIGDVELRVTIPAANLSESNITSSDVESVSQGTLERPQVHAPVDTLDIKPNARILVRFQDQPTGDVGVLALFPNKTWQSATTDANGEAWVELYTTELPMTVFIAAVGYRANIERDWLPSSGPLTIALEQLPDGGAAIFPNGTGSLPGLNGRLNPIRDALDRTYLHATNVSINDGQQQPVHFVPGAELMLTDAYGNQAEVRIIDVIGRSSLVEYCYLPSA